MNKDQITFIRTNNKNQAFIDLVKMLDEDLKVTDGDDHDFYNQFNGIDQIKHVLVVYSNEIIVGCGAVKHHDENSVEVKRMFVLDSYRGKGVATDILKSLEAWAKELGYSKCILETGNRQISAIALYKKNGYSITENYDQYIGVENSVCFAKELS